MVIRTTALRQVIIIVESKTEGYLLLLLSDNPVFLETQMLIARCIQRTSQIELDTGKEDQEKSVNTDLNIEAEVAAAMDTKVCLDYL